MTDKPKAVCGRPSLKRCLGFPPPPTLGLCLGAFWGGMGILKPSLNNFNHREKNVIIHPKLIPEDEFEAPFRLKKKQRGQARCGMEAAIHGRPGVDGTSLGTSIAKLPEMTVAGNCKWSWRMKNVGTKWSKTPQSLQCVVPFYFLQLNSILTKDEKL